jgi:integrase
MNEERFWFHKFRDTFATWALRRAVDIRTVSHWLGHSAGRRRSKPNGRVAVP